MSQQEMRIEEIARATEDKKEKVCGESPESIGIFGKKINKKLIVAAFLIIFILIYLTQNCLYIQKDQFPLFTDWQIVRSLMYYDYLVLKNDIPFFSIPYPPVTYLVTQVFYVLGGVSTTSARLSLSFFVVIFLLSMFGIGKELGGRYSGAVVMALAAASPHILNLSRFYFLEFPQTAMTALSLYLLLKTDGFVNRKYSLIFGVVLALSFLTKWSTAFFMIVPVLWFFIPVFFRKGNSVKVVLAYIIPATITFYGLFIYFGNVGSSGIPGKSDWLLQYITIVFLPVVVSTVLLLLFEKGRISEEGYRDTGAFRLTNFGLMSAIFSLLVFPWYFISRLRMGATIGLYSDGSRFSEFTGSIVFNFFETIFNFFPVFLILPVVGFVLNFVFFKINFYRRLMIPVTLILSLLLMWKITFTEVRYILSLIIFLAAMSGFWINHLGKVKIYVTVIIVLISLCSILTWTLFPGDPPIFFTVGHEVRYAIESPDPVLLCPPPPCSSDLNPGEIIDWFNSSEWEKIILFDCDETFFQYKGRIGAGPATEFRLGSYTPHYSIMEYIWVESFKKKKRIEVLQKPELINNFIVLHRKEAPEKQIDRETARLFPDIKFQKKSYYIGEGLVITGVKLKR